jgi:hypothetical protein
MNPALESSFVEELIRRGNREATLRSPCDERAQERIEVAVGIDAVALLGG